MSEQIEQDLKIAKWEMNRLKEIVDYQSNQSYWLVTPPRSSPDPRDQTIAQLQSDLRALHEGIERLTERWKEIRS